MKPTLFAIISATLARLRPYQLGWLDAMDDHPFCALLGGRQIGKDYALAYYAVSKALLEPRSAWNTFSASAKHASQWLDDCRDAYDFIRRATVAAGMALPERGVGLRDNVTTLELYNGSVIMSNASTVRSAVGLRGSVLLNEIGVLPNARAMFEAVYPIVTGAIDNGRPAKMMIVSNASQRGTYWHEWFTGTRSDGWHRVTTTWADAMTSWGWSEAKVKRGADLKRRQLGEGGYSQWYDCKWRSAEDGFFPIKLLDRQTWGEAWGRPYVARPDTPQIVGYDIGRHVDPCAFARLHLPVHGPYAHQHVVMDTEHHFKMEYGAQRARLEQLGGERLTHKAVIDATGVGDAQYEQCSEAMPFECVRQIFTPQSIQAMFGTILDGLQGGTLWIPGGDLDLRMQLESVTATYQAGGKVTMHLPYEAGAHADCAVAMAMASYGASVVNSGYWQADWSALH